MSEQTQQPAVQENFSTSTGQIVVVWPGGVTQDELDDVLSWLRLVERKLIKSAADDEDGDKSIEYLIAVHPVQFPTEARMDPKEFQRKWKAQFDPRIRDSIAGREDHVATAHRASDGQSVEGQAGSVAAADRPEYLRRAVAEWEINQSICVATLLEAGEQRAGDKIRELDDELAGRQPISRTVEQDGVCPECGGELLQTGDTTARCENDHVFIVPAGERERLAEVLDQMEKNRRDLAATQTIVEIRGCRVYVPNDEQGGKCRNCGQVNCPATVGDFPAGPCECWNYAQNMVDGRWCCANCGKPVPDDDSQRQKHDDRLIKLSPLNGDLQITKEMLDEVDKLQSLDELFQQARVDRLRRIRDHSRSQFGDGDLCECPAAVQQQALRSEDSCWYCLTCERRIDEADLDWHSVQRKKTEAGNSGA